MTIYTHTAPSKSYCRHFNIWCVMANGYGECSVTACSYGYDRKTYTNRTEAKTKTVVYDYMIGKGGDTE